MFIIPTDPISRNNEYVIIDPNNETYAGSALAAGPEIRNKTKKVTIKTTKDDIFVTLVLFCAILYLSDSIVIWSYSGSHQNSAENVAQD